MKSTPIVTFDIPLMAIKHMWGSQKILGFIDTEGGICNEPGILYLSRHIENHYNVSILPVLHIHTIVRYFSACNTIYNHNRIIQSNLAIEKYRVAQSGYFRLSNTVELGMGISDWKLLFCNGISEQIKDNDILMRE